MIVDHADGLHERITDGRSHERKAAPAQVFAQRIRNGRARGDVARRSPARNDRASVDETPNVPIEAAELFAHRKQGARVGYRGEHLRAIAYDSGIAKDSLAAPFRETRDGSGFEAREQRAVPLALAKDRVPTQTGLRAFENEEFEQHPIVVRRHTPLRVVVRDGEIVFRPSTTHARLHPSMISTSTGRTRCAACG